MVCNHDFGRSRLNSVGLRRKSQNAFRTVARTDNRLRPAVERLPVAAPEIGEVRLVAVVSRNNLPRPINRERHGHLGVGNDKTFRVAHGHVHVADVLAVGQNGFCLGLKHEAHRRPRRPHLVSRPLHAVLPDHDFKYARLVFHVVPPEAVGAVPYTELLTLTA